MQILFLETDSICIPTRYKYVKFRPAPFNVRDRRFMSVHHYCTLHYTTVVSTLHYTTEVSTLHYTTVVSKLHYTTLLSTVYCSLCSGVHSEQCTLHHSTVQRKNHLFRLLFRHFFHLTHPPSPLPPPSFSPTLLLPFPLVSFSKVIISDGVHFCRLNKSINDSNLFPI